MDSPRASSRHPQSSAYQFSDVCCAQSVSGECMLRPHRGGFRSAADQALLPDRAEARINPFA